MIGQHLLSVDQLTKQQVVTLMDNADTMRELDHKHIIASSGLAHTNLGLLFFEHSTRTRISFEIAARRLGANVILLQEAMSSTQKGESLTDTVCNLVAMGINLLVIRHMQQGIVQQLAEQVGRKACIVNAGDGAGEHPTQALQDIYTLSHCVNSLQSLRILILGDILHSRVAHSLIKLLVLMGVTDIRIVAPKNLLLSDEKQLKGTVVHDRLTEALPGVDVIYILRLQQERFSDQVGTVIFDQSSYIKNYRLNPSHLSLAGNQVHIMHPGPVNQGVEISHQLVDSDQSIILKQVSLGIPMRMAILTALSSPNMIA